MTHHDAVSVERTEPARREDCGAGGAAADRWLLVVVQRRFSSLLSKPIEQIAEVRMSSDADRRAL